MQLQCGHIETFGWFCIIFLLSLISWPGMIDNDPDIGVCMSWEEENPPEDVPPVS